MAEDPTGRIAGKSGKVLAVPVLLIAVLVVINRVAWPQALH